MRETIVLNGGSSNNLSEMGRTGIICDVIQREMPNRAAQSRIWQNYVNVASRLMRQPEEHSVKCAPEERLGNQSPYPWIAEHHSRYHFAAQFVRSKRVADIACGTGIGLAILSDAGAREILAIDRDARAVSLAASRPVSGVVRCVADGAALPVRSSSVDVITSFETLEHVPSPRAFLSELARVLRQEGTLLLSTPNALYTKPVGGRPKNPYHLYEYRPDELERLLARHFETVTLVGQRVAPRFGLAPYWELPERIPRDGSTRMKVMLWKLMNRALPLKVNDFISRRVAGRAFFPSAADFEFSTSAVEVGHVLLAICRTPRSAGA